MSIKVESPKHLYGDTGDNRPKAEVYEVFPDESKHYVGDIVLDEKDEHWISDDTLREWLRKPFQSNDHIFTRAVSDLKRFIDGNMKYLGEGSKVGRWDYMQSRINTISHNFGVMLKQHKELVEQQEAEVKVRENHRRRIELLERHTFIYASCEDGATVVLTTIAGEEIEIHFKEPTDASLVTSLIEQTRQAIISGDDDGD